MHDPIAPIPADLGQQQQQIVVALERQASALSLLRARVADAVDTVPAAVCSGWQGLAALAFDAALAALRRDLASTLLQLDSALGDTRQAIATLRGRG